MAEAARRTQPWLRIAVADVALWNAALASVEPIVPGEAAPMPCFVEGKSPPPDSTRDRTGSCARTGRLKAAAIRSKPPKTRASRALVEGPTRCDPGSLDKSSEWASFYSKSKQVRVFRG